MCQCIGFIIFGEMTMIGEQLFESKTKRDFTGSEEDEYAQDLMTIFSHIGTDLFPLLEEAEKTQKKVRIKVFPEGVYWDEITLDNLYIA